MLSKSRLTLLRSLRQKKGRRDHSLFVAEGSKLTLELLHSSFRVETIYANREWLEQNRAVAGKAQELIEIDNDSLSRISSLVSPQDVLAVVRIPERSLSPAGLKNEFTLVLDGIRDPGNMGTIIRIADWFGIRNIICSPDSAETWNPKVVQASMGSITRVNVYEESLPEFFGTLQQAQSIDPFSLPVFGTFLEGENIYSCTLPEAGILVIGNEGSGIRPETERFISQKITIPSFAANGAESLNAAVATAIACSEFRRSSLTGSRPA
jgi:TrmH family RNA methyltransferase